MLAAADVLDGGLRVPRDVAEQLLTTGVVTRAFLGIRQVELYPELVRQFRLPVQEGVLVVSVDPGTPAAQAGRCNPSPLRQRSV